jgi:hypothetical protein
MTPRPYSIEAIRVALNSGADRRWLRADLDFADRETFAIDDANAGFFKADVQSNVQFHRSSPFATTFQVVAPGSGFGHGRVTVVHRYLEARFEEP